jgi:hypothetical protein
MAAAMTYSPTASKQPSQSCQYRTYKEVGRIMDKTALPLNSRKTILASLALRCTDDKALGEAMRHADTVLACLPQQNTEVNTE